MPSDDTRALTEDEEAAWDRFLTTCPVECDDPEIEDAVKSDMQRAFIAGLRYRDEAVAAVLDEAEDFIERVTQWTGSDPDEREEMLQRFAALSAARKASP